MAPNIDPLEHKGLAFAATKHLDPTPIFDQEDIDQEALANLVFGMRHLDPNRPFSPSYIYRTCRTQTQREVMRQTRTGCLPYNRAPGHDPWMNGASYAPDMDYRNPHNADPTDRIMIKLTIKKLPKRQQLVIELRYYHHKTLKQVGRALSVSTERARQIENEAIASMRKILLNK